MMFVTGALTLVLAVAPAPGADRVLLCRPKVTGDPALARGAALVDAAKRTGRFLDYGVVCEDAAEGARAARRVGLGHAVSATADGRADGSRYVLVLSDSQIEAERARRAIDVSTGADAVEPLRGALTELLRALPAPPARRRVGPWATVGAGVASIAAGVAFGLKARSAADEASAAADPAAYTRARADWRSRRTASGVLLGAGAAAVAGGLTWRFAF